MLSPVILRPLRSRRLRRLWAGQTAALLGAEFHLVVIAWLALELTGSGLALGSVLVAGMIPRIVFTLVGGVAADRMGHRRILVIGNASRVVVVVVLGVLVQTGDVRLWHLYAVGLILGAITSFYMPALYTAIPRESPPDEVRAGNALMRGTAEAAGAIGPVTGGLLVAAFGTGTSVWITAACYAIATLGLGRLLQAEQGPVMQEPSQPVVQARKSVSADLAAGFAALRQDPFLFRVLLLISAAGLALSGPITVGVPWLAREEFGVTAVAFGLMLSMWTTGSLLGVVIAGSVSSNPRWRGLVALVTAVLAAALAVLGLTDALVVAALCLLVMGTAAGAFNIFLLTWLQQRTRPELLGRLMSFAELAEVITAPASYLLAGWLLDVSVRWMFLGASAVVLLSSLVVVISRTNETRDDPTEQPDAQRVATEEPA